MKPHVIRLNILERAKVELTHECSPEHLRMGTEDWNKQKKQGKKVRREKVTQHNQSAKKHSDTEKFTSAK